MYKIYTTRITQFGSPGIAIVTSFKNAGGYFKAESFCIFPPPHAEQAFNALRFEQKSFEDCPIELDEEFMLEQALAQARTDIATHLERNYAGKAFLIPPGELQLREVEVSFLVHLRVRDTADFLWDVKNRTNCGELRATIEPILGLPPISRRPL
jgi:hypothetical protein